ncbi:MAG: nuclear transport factor 2 family protein [Firmicutes bacterium]|nr:nuclear transport factor 2 family protein [Bacillota bacterium]
MSLEILEAKEEIRELIDTFSNYECDVHAQAPLFTEDTHVMVYMGGQLAMDIHGSGELEKQFSAFTVGVKASHHMNGQQVIVLNGKEETDTHYCRAALLTAEGGKEYISDNYIRYVDTLVRVEGKWKIKVREQHFLITEKREVNK